MRIGMILDYVRDWPPGIRAEKQSRALAEAGHAVFVLSPKYGKDSATTEWIDHCSATVDRVEIAGTRGRYLRNAIRAVTLFDERMQIPIREFVERRQVEVLHVHDIWMVPVAQAVAGPLGIPVVADLHENMPAAVRAARTEYGTLRRLASSVFSNYHLMRWHEARMLRRCAHVLVVAPEAAERLDGYGIDPDRVSVVSNTEDESTFDIGLESIDQEIVARHQGAFLASYVGGAGAHRGLDTVLRGARRIMEVVPDFKLVIVGADPKTLSWIRDRVARDGTTEVVEALGWQPFKAVQSYIKASDVCLVPHNDFEHTQTTVPHKLFQYMICAKPVLVSDCRPLKRIVQDANCGSVFEASNPDSFAERLIEMYRDRAQLERLGRNGRSAALGKYSWRHDATRLVGIYGGLQELPRRGA